MNLHTEESNSLKEIEIQEEKRTFSINVEHLSNLEALAYWERTSMKEIIDEALTQYFQDKKVKPLPSEKKKRRGRKPA